MACGGAAAQDGDGGNLAAVTVLEGSACDVEDGVSGVDNDELWKLSIAVAKCLL